MEEKESENKKGDELKIRIPNFLYFDSKKLKDNFWLVSTFVLVIVAILVLLYAYGAPSMLSSGNAISSDQAGQKVLDFVNSNSQINGTISVDSVSDLGSLYQVMISYQDNSVPVYITKQGDYLVQNAVPLNN